MHVIVNKIVRIHVLKVLKIRASKANTLKVLCFAINSINDIYLQQYRSKEKKTRILTDLNMGHFSQIF